MTTTVPNTQKEIRAHLPRLNSADLFERRGALDALQRAGREAIPALLVVLHTREASVREAAAWALGEIGSPLAVPGLLAALEHETDFTVRDSVAFALEMIGDARAVPALTDCLAHDDEIARDSLAAALSQFDDAEALPLLVEGLHSDDPAVRQAAAWALAGMGTRSEQEYLQTHIVPALSEALDDACGKVRWVAIKGLHELSMAATACLQEISEQIIERLEDTFPSPWGDNARICDVAALTLEQVNTPRCRTALQRWRARRAY